MCSCGSGVWNEMRLDIFTSLRHFIARNRNLGIEENKTELARDSKKDLPILKTIKMYFMIFDTEMVNTMFNRPLEKYRTENLQFT